MAKKVKQGDRFNQFIKLLIIALLLMLAMIIFFVYQAVVTQAISLPFLMTIILILVIPTFFIIVQLLTALTNRSRLVREDGRKKTQPYK